MSVHRPLMCVVLALGFVLVAQPAEARFGKRSSSSDSDSKKDDQDDDTPVHRASPSPEKVHEASAVTREPPSRPQPSYSDDSPSHPASYSDDDGDCCYEPGVRVTTVAPEITPYVDTTVDLFTLLFGGKTHMDVELRPGPDGVVPGQLHAAPAQLRLGLQGGPLGGGAGLDAFVGMDLERMGAEFRVTGLGLPTDDGTDGTDVITLIESHLSYALAAEDHFRLRAEGGLSSAHAPDIDLYGLSLGMSMEACVVGPLDIEARVQATPFPYRQVDASAALALHLGAVMLRAGYRGLILDDAGTVDGIQHVDQFRGPFFGMGLNY